jgi:hypothetical protein
VTTPPGVADDVCVALLESEQLAHVEPSVHARHYRDLLGRRQREVAFVEALRVTIVVRE